MNHFQNHQLGIIFGPYGTIGYSGTIQREDLKEIAQIFFGLFRWAKHYSKRLWHCYKKSYREHIVMTMKRNRQISYTSLF
jgi:hypothetical protein